jgi:hypothetical protein
MAPILRANNKRELLTAASMYSRYPGKSLDNPAGNHDPACGNRRFKSDRPDLFQNA